MKTGIGAAAMLAAAFVLAGPVGGASLNAAGGEPSVLVVQWDRSDLSLARLDPRSLEPLSAQRVPLGRQVSGTGRSAYTWAFSPDGSQVAVGGRLLGGLRFANISAMTLAARMGVQVEPLAWMSSRRLLAGEQGDPYSSPDTVVTIDPVQRRVVARRSLGGAILRTARANDKLVFLVAGTRRIGPARVVVVGGNGKVRRVTLRRISGGSVTTGSSFDTRHVYPGLAVDPHSRRAFVVGTTRLVAEVSLETLAVRYHQVGPSALKLSSGPVRYARWVGNELLAVSGYDDEVYKDAAGARQQTSKPNGLRLIDTHSWTVRTLDHRATSFAVTEGSLIAYGVAWTSAGNVRTGMGVAAYTPAGERRFQAFADEPISWLQVVGAYAYVAQGNDVAVVIDAATGETVARVDRSMPVVLVPGEPAY